MIRHYSPVTGPFVLGIDPGLDGGIAALGLDGQTLAVGPMPVKAMTKSKREVDTALLFGLLCDLGLRIELAVVERVGPMPGQGVTSCFNFGMGYGKILGLLESKRIAFQLVTPQAWKKTILAGTDRSKAAAIAYCQRRFPHVDLRATDRSRTPSDGIADALCLAEFARRLAVGEEAA